MYQSKDFHFVQLSCCYRRYLFFINMVPWTLLLCYPNRQNVEMKILEMMCYFRNIHKSDRTFCLLCVRNL